MSEPKTIDINGNAVDVSTIALVLSTDDHKITHNNISFNSIGIIIAMIAYLLIRKYYNPDKHAPKNKQNLYTPDEYMFAQYENSHIKRLPYPLYCPILHDTNQDLRDRYNKFILEILSKTITQKSDSWHKDGLLLAKDLRSGAQNTSKEMDMSPDLFWLDYCAAIVCYAVEGINSDIFHQYRKSVDYYKIFNGTKADVAEFSEFIRADPWSYLHRKQ